MKTRMKFLLFVAVLMSVIGCATNPVKIAQTNEQKGYAVLGQFVIVEEQAGNLICGPATETRLCPGNPAVPDNVRATIKAVDAAAAPVVKSLTEIVTEVGGILAQLSTCPGQDNPADCKLTAQERLRVANANLVRWIEELLPLVAQLKTSIGR